MILVTVGNYYKGFPRLVEKMDEIAGKISEDVTMQIGNTDFEPRNADYFRFTSEAKINELYLDARIVVCHDGAGSMLTALKYNKPTIVIPRLKEYGEHAYDNPADLAKELEREKRVILVFDVNRLEEVIRRIETIQITPVKDRRLVKSLRECINAIDSER